MNKINTLVSEIKGTLSAALTKRIERLQELETKLITAKELNEKEPSEANQQNLDDLKETITDYVEDLSTTLSSIIEEEKVAVIPLVVPIEKKEDKKSSGLGWGLLATVVLSVLTLGAIKMSKK